MIESLLSKRETRYSKAIRFAAYCNTPNEGTNSHHYEIFSNQAVTIADGDKLVYSMFPQGRICATGIDAFCYNPDGTGFANLRDWGYDYRIDVGSLPKLVDQHGITLHAQGPGVDSIPLNQWYYRVIDISPASGKIIKMWGLVLEGDLVGDYTTYFNHIHIRDKNDNLKALLFGDQLEVVPLSTYDQAGTVNYINIRKDVVQLNL